MSLAVIQSYSSAEDDEEEEIVEGDEEEEQQNSSDDEAPSTRCKPLFNSSHASHSDLPSAFDAFSQVSGPPQFLNHSVEENVDNDQGRRTTRNRKSNKDFPAGAVMEAKAQLVGIHERVRSDIEGNQPPTSVSSTTQGVKHVATATNPSAEDAELLRMCLQCGIPKTCGMFCPVCGDRLPVDTSKEPKRKGSIIKVKEKSKKDEGTVISCHLEK